MDEHIAQKRAIWERYEKGLADLPVKMNPWDREKSQPNFWLSCCIIDAEAMAHMVRGEQDYMYQSESGKSSPQEILDALAAFNAEGRPIWKPMHMQPIYRTNPFVTVEGTVMLPRMTALISSGNRKESDDLFKLSLECTAIVGIAMAFGVAAIAKEFEPVFFGPGYEECILLTIVLAPVLIIKALSFTARYQYLIPHHKEKTYTRIPLLQAFTRTMTRNTRWRAFSSARKKVIFSE